jgi:hypothetical protein
MDALLSLEDLTGVFSVTDVVICLLLSFVLSSAIGWVYQITHRGASYTQSFVQTLVLNGMVVSVIMMIVGSNIARAFALVGALSIIRFRNAVKETRDVGFIFFTMAIGMAIGTKFYLLAAVSALVISLIIHCTIHDSGARGIQVAGPGLSPALTNTTIENNAGQAIYQSTLDMTPTYLNLALTGNGTDAVVFNAGYLYRPLTLDGPQLNGSPFIALDHINVQSSGHLTLTAGTELLMSAARGLDGPARCAHRMWASSPSKIWRQVRCASLACHGCRKSLAATACTP